AAPAWAFHDVGVGIVPHAIDGATAREVRIRSSRAASAAGGPAATSSSSARRTPEARDAVDAIGRIVPQLATGIRVNDPLGLAAVALELRFDPVDCLPIAFGALTPIAKLRQSLQGLLVSVEAESTP